VVVRLDIMEARVLVIGGLLMGFLGRWRHIEAEAKDEFHMLAVVGIEGVVFGYTMEVGWVVGVVLVMQLSEHRCLPLLLLVRDLDGVLELSKSCHLHVNVLPSGFGTLSCCLPFCDGFLLLIEPLNLLLNPG
jgi:hypothetical protein